MPVRFTLLALTSFTLLGLVPGADQVAQEQASSAGVILDAGVTLEFAVDGGVGVASLESESAEALLPGLLPPSKVPDRLKHPPIQQLQSIPRAQDVLGRARRGKDGKLYAVHGSGAAVPLTIDVGLQDQLVQILKSYETPIAAAVVLEPSTGRVLAMAEYSHEEPSLRGISTRAAYPAASIFKIVTASALLRKGVSADEKECFHGGLRRLTESLLEDSPRDGDCYTLATAMGKSANVVFAKLTQRYLETMDLRAEAARYRFNRDISFPMPTEVSLAGIPEESFAFAETGAGFGDVYLSPLHGALLASVAANGGVWREPVLIEGAPTAEPERILEEDQASALTDMLEETVTDGTARRIFRERGFRVDGAVGKTGTLADRKPFRDYSWFVGFAPRDNPRVAVAALIVNGPKWRIRGTWLGREAMRLALARLPPLEEKAPLRVEGAKSEGLDVAAVSSAPAGEGSERTTAGTGAVVTTSGGTSAPRTDVAALPSPAPAVLPAREIGPGPGADRPATAP